MAIVTDVGGTMVTGKDIETYRLISLRSALKLDTMGNGMRFSRRVNVRKLAAEELKLAGRKAPRNARELYNTFDAYVREITGR